MAEADETRKLEIEYWATLPNYFCFVVGKIRPYVIANGNKGIELIVLLIRSHN